MHGAEASFALALLAVVAVGCCGGGSAPTTPAGPPAPSQNDAPETAAPATPATSATPATPATPASPAAAATHVHPLCGHPDEARLRAAYPGLPACARGRPFSFLEAAVRGRRLFVAGWGIDPCCTDVLGPGTSAGSIAFVDGRALPAVRSLVDELGDLSGADEPTALTLLQARLLEIGAVGQVLDGADVAALVARWPAAAPLLASRPPGLVRDGDGFRLFVWTESDYVERGIDCHYLDGWAARLGDRGDATVLIGPNFAEPSRHARYSEGTAMGRPCDGEPLPPR